jgi:hypothetical protein
MSNVISANVTTAVPMATPAAAASCRRGAGTEVGVVGAPKRSPGARSSGLRTSPPAGALAALGVGLPLALVLGVGLESAAALALGVAAALGVGFGASSRPFGCASWPASFMP